MPEANLEPHLLAPNEDFIVDSAHKFVGTRQEAARQRGWNYYLPEN